MKKIVHKAVDPNIKVTEYVKENLTTLKSHNTNNLTILVTIPIRPIDQTINITLSIPDILINVTNIHNNLDD